MCLIIHRMLEQGIFCLRYCSGIGRAVNIEKKFLFYNKDLENLFFRSLFILNY